MSSFIDHRGDGSNKSFLIPFEYYENDQLFAYVDNKLVEIEQYNKNSIVLKDIPPSGSLVRIRRIVDVDTPFATYVTGSDLTEDTLNKNNLKLLYGIQQLNDGFIDDDFYFKQDISMGDNRIIDVADGVDDTDAVNYSQVKNLDANVKQIEQNIIRLEQQAKASKDAAGVSENNAKTSETNAKTSETNSKVSETNSKVSETNSKESELLAKASEDAAGVSENNAKQYADAAKVSETNSKTSETNSKVSETNSKDSELLAKQYADAAKVSETNAKTSEINSKTSETNAKTSETNAKESELLAKKYADESKSTKPDYKTIFIDTAGNIATKDIAINEDKDDLASKRGQIGKCYNLTSGIDFNTLFNSGRYWINNARLAASSNTPPTTAGGFCDVLGGEAGSNYTKQIYHEYNKPVIYIREHKGTTEGWNETWTRIITEKNLATSSTPGIVKPGTGLQIGEEGALNVVAEQTGCLPLTGGTMTGDIGFNAIGTEDRIGTITAVSADGAGKYLVFDTYEEGDVGAYLVLRKGSDPYNPGGFEITVRNADNSVQKYVQARLDGRFFWDGSEVFLTAGSVFAFAGNIDVPGCLICNGAVVSRSTYWRLFNAIGTTYGAGDGSTTFHLPNIEGRFIQGSATAGTYVNAGLPNITGEYYNVGIEGTNGNSSGAITRNNINDTRWSHSSTVYNDRGGFVFYASNSNPIYGTSNTVQPPALTMRYYIKY